MAPVKADLDGSGRLEEALPNTTFRATRKSRRFGAGLCPFHSPLLRASRLFSFPPLINMLKFGGSPRLLSGRKEEKKCNETTKQQSLRSFAPKRSGNRDSEADPGLESTRESVAVRVSKSRAPPWRQREKKKTRGHGDRESRRSRSLLSLREPNAPSDKTTGGGRISRRP